jgi:hypothetical protein
LIAGYQNLILISFIELTMFISSCIFLYAKFIHFTHIPLSEEETLIIKDVRGFKSKTITLLFAFTASKALVALPANYGTDGLDY